MSGFGQGYCAGARSETAGAAGSMPGRGFGRTFGGLSARCGHGWRNLFSATGQPGWRCCGAANLPAKNNPLLEKQTLEGLARSLQTQLDHVKQRLATIETPGSES